MKSFYGQKIDSTQRAIVDALRAHGASVYSIGRPIDLLIGWRGQTFVAEVKTPTGKFKESQVKFFQGWFGGLAVVLTSVDDVIKLLDGGEAHTLMPSPDQLKQVRA